MTHLRSSFLKISLSLFCIVWGNPALALDKEGFIDSNGNFVVPVNYREVHSFENGWGTVSEFPKNPFELKRDFTFQTLINPKGEKVATVKSSWLGPCRDGLLNDHDGWFRNTKGEKVVAAPYGTTDFGNDFAARPEYNKLGAIKKFDLIDVTGKKCGAVPDGLHVASYALPCEGFLIVSKLEQEGYIDRTGTVTIPIQYRSANNFSENLACVGIRKDNKSLYGYIDKSGEMVIPTMYDAANDFHEGLAAVSNKSKWSYIDKFGKTVFELPQNCKHTTRFSDGLTAVAILPPGVTLNIELSYDHPTNAEIAKKCLWGFVDQKGKMVIEPRFRIRIGTASGIIVPEFSNGLCAVSVNPETKDLPVYGYIDKSGNFVIKPQFKFADKFCDGLARVRMGPTHFVPADWKLAIQAEETWERNHMLTALGRDYELIGMTKTQVMEVLGAPNEKSNAGLDWFYLLGKGGCGNGDIWLEIRFHANKIASYRLADLQKQGAWQKARGHSALITYGDD